MGVWAYGCMGVGWMGACVYAYECLCVWVYGCMDVWVHGCIFDVSVSKARRCAQWLKDERLSNKKNIVDFIITNAPSAFVQQYNLKMVTDPTPTLTLTLTLT